MNLGRSLSTEQLLQRDVSLSSMRGSGRGQRQGSRAASAPAGCTTVIDLTGETEFEKLCDEPQTRAVDPTRSHHERAVNKVAQHEVNEVNSLNQNSSAVIHTAGEVNGKYPSRSINSRRPPLLFLSSKTSKSSFSEHLADCVSRSNGFCRATPQPPPASEPPAHFHAPLRSSSFATSH